MIRAALFGAVLGFLVAVSGACGPSSKCSASTCNGCCDTSGTCKLGTTPDACGGIGSTCTACLGGQLCQGGFCSGGATGGGNGTGGGGGGGGGGGSSSGSVATFKTQLAHDYCAKLISCGIYVSATASADCEAYVVERLGGQPPEEAIGAVSLNSGESTTCTSRLSALTCADLRDGFEPGDCSAAIAPAARTNDRCYVSDECKDPGTGCGGSSVCARRCIAAGGNGQPCAAYGKCDSDLRCDDSETCVPKFPPNAPCVGYDDCDSHGRCENGFCFPLPSTGPCHMGFACDSTAYCQYPNCAPRKASGLSCQSPGECQTGLTCRSGQCQLPLPNGAACRSLSDCDTGLQCDRVLRTCQKSADATLGQSCTGDALSCVNGNTCKGVVVLVDGGVGAPGTCQVPALGDSCTKHSTCPLGAYCTGSTVSAGVCVTAGVSTPCTYDQNCRPADFCHYVGSQASCLPRYAHGMTCAQSSCLDPADSCIDNAGGGSTCRVPGVTGDVCTGTSSSDCLFPNRCIGGHCTLTGHRGQPCSDFAGCFDGACQLRDGGFGADLTGTCVAPQPTGTRCHDGHGCTSGFCSLGVCTTPC